MEFVTGQRQVVINFSEVFCKTETEVLNSACFKEVWKKFISNVKKAQKQDMIKVLKLFAKPESDYIKLFKLLLSFSLDEIKAMSPFYNNALDHAEDIYALVEDFYDYWRRLERYAVVFSKASIDGVESSTFISAQSEFNNVVLKTYRAISEKLYGSKFPIYRQLPAGVNAALLISKHKWMKPDSEYAFLEKSEAIEQILIRPPFISYSEKNKRTGIYQEVFENPINLFKDNFKATEYYCYPARVGSALTYVYFHRDYMAHGITLCNLFEFVPLSDCKGMKPDCIYIFGAPIDGDSVFYHDQKNDIYVGVAPHNASIDYFGYMKKMLLTLYNVKMIEQGNLPLHGACVHITMKNGTTKNIVIIGDSGAGKSESLEALSAYAGDNISSQLTIFDDMGTFKLQDGKIKAYGTEIGAFVRLDDMASGYAYNEMDRAIFMNPDKINSRLVIPVATYPQIMKGYEIDMVLYANNYDEYCESEVSFFSDVEAAKACFIRGARKAKGTTQEVGLVESFFANPFGPVQREEKTRILIDKYFQTLFDANIPVGQLHTKLAVPGLEHDGPAAAAKKLFALLDK